MFLKITSFAACCNICFSVFSQGSNIRTFLSSVFTLGLASMQQMFEQHNFLVSFCPMFCLFTFCAWHIRSIWEIDACMLLCGNGKNQSRGQNTGRQNAKGKGRGKPTYEPSQPRNPLTQPSKWNSRSCKMRPKHNTKQGSLRLFRKQLGSKCRSPWTRWMDCAYMPSSRVDGRRRCQLCWKDVVPDVLRRIGYTQAPCAIVTTQIGPSNRTSRRWTHRKNRRWCRQQAYQPSIFIFRRCECQTAQYCYVDGPRFAQSERPGSCTQLTRLLIRLRPFGFLNRFRIAMLCNL